MILTVYDFFNPLGAGNQKITTLGTSWQYWVPLVICALIFATLFIFRKFYLRLARSKVFLIGLGSVQLLLYVVYYFLHFLYIYYFGEDKNYSLTKNPQLYLRGWTWIFPLHLSSITQILSGILLIKPNDRVFSVTAPWVAVMVSISFVMPAVTNYGPQHFFYWLFYIIHLIIVFTYWFLYMYGLTKYHRDYLLWSFITLIIFSLIALGVNALSLKIYQNPTEKTNFLYIGYDGYGLWGKGKNRVTTANIFGNQNLWPLGYFFILIFGIIFTSIGYLVLTKVQPYYQWNAKRTKLVPVKRMRQKWDFASFGRMFKEFKNIFKN